MIGLTLLVRIRTFFTPVDGNVGLYVHVAHDWLHGSLPYVSTWEYKPPGLFALIALALAAVPSTTVAMAALAAVAVASTAILLVTFFERAEIGRRAGVLAGIFYILLTSEDAGLLGDAELFVAPFICAALTVLAPFKRERETKPVWRYALAGLFVGAGLQMTLLAFPLVLLLVAAIALREGRRSFVPAATALAAAMAPFVAEAGFYAQARHFAEFYDANVGATVRRLASRGADAPPADMHDFKRNLSMLTPAPQLALLAPFSGVLREQLVLWIWLALAVATIAITGEFYGSQLVLTIAPLAALTAIGVDGIASATPRPQTVCIALALGMFAMHGYAGAREFGKFAYHRYVLRDAAYERAHVTAVELAVRPYVWSGGSLYVIDESAELYDALGVRAPTRYAFTADLLERNLWPMLGFDGIHEIERVLRLRPTFVLVGRHGAHEDAASLRTVAFLLARDYRRIANVGPATLYAADDKQVRVAHGALH